MPFFGYEKCVGGNQQSRKIQIYEIFLYSIIFFIFALKAVGLSYTNKSKFCIFEHATFYCTRFFFKLVDFFRLRIFHSRRQEKKSRPKMYTPFFYSSKKQTCRFIWKEYPTDRVIIRKHRLATNRIGENPIQNLPTVRFPRASRVIFRSWLRWKIISRIE